MHGQGLTLQGATSEASHCGGETELRNLVQLVTKQTDKQITVTSLEVRSVPRVATICYFKCPRSKKKKKKKLRDKKRMQRSKKL